MRRLKRASSASKLCVCAMFLSLISASPASSQSASEFYSGRMMTMYVPSGSGGINDASGRLVARHLPKFLPGAPTFVVQNVPGAGGLTLANRLFTTLPGTALSYQFSSAERRNSRSLEIPPHALIRSSSRGWGQFRLIRTTFIF